MRKEESMEGKMTGVLERTILEFEILRGQRQREGSILRCTTPTSQSAYLSKDGLLVVAAAPPSILLTKVLTNPA
jgi:hypothetical protein